MLQPIPDDVPVSPTLTTEAECFQRNGVPHRIIFDGAHYFRIFPCESTARLTKGRAMGCNMVETCTAWNFHALSHDVVDSSWRDRQPRDH